MEFMNEESSVSETIDISNSADWIKFNNKEVSNLNPNPATATLTFPH